MLVAILHRPFLILKTELSKVYFIKKYEPATFSFCLFKIVNKHLSLFVVLKFQLWGQVLLLSDFLSFDFVFQVKSSQ